MYFLWGGERVLMKLGQTCRNSKQEGRCRRGEARARAETELAVWQNSILPFPPLRSSPLPSRHLSHAPRLSPPLPGPSQSLPLRGLFFSPRVLACRPALLGSVSPQRRWACGASDPRSPTLAFSVSALLLLGGGRGYGRTALTSAHRGGSGLHRSVQLSAFLFFSGLREDDRVRGGGRCLWGAAGPARGRLARAWRRRGCRMEAARCQVNAKTPRASRAAEAAGIECCGDLRCHSRVWTWEWMWGMRGDRAALCGTQRMFTSMEGLRGSAGLPVKTALKLNFLSRDWAG